MNWRQRLFVFLACGFRSSSATDLEVVQGLRRIGFDLKYQPVAPRNVTAFLSAVSVYLILMTTITSQLAVLFHETVGTDQYKESFVLLIPMEADREVRWLWTITSGIFSLAAVATAFAIRQARLNRFSIGLTSS